MTIREGGAIEESEQLLLASPERPVFLKTRRLVDPVRRLDGPGAVLMAKGVILDSGPEALARAREGLPEGTIEISCGDDVLAPGLIDCQVFVGEPGYEHRETLASASRAAVAGGVTSFITMPDTHPVIDDPALVHFLLRRAQDTACVRVYPMAALTKNLDGKSLAEIGLLQEAGAIAFTNGRHSISDAGVMRRVLSYTCDFDALLVHHVQEPSLVRGGVMNEGEVASRLGLMGIPCEAEVVLLERDIRLQALTGGRYHAAQVSCALSCAVLEQARARGQAITAGVSVAHLTLNENDIGAYRTFFKISPPLRREEDRLAMGEALRANIIDVIISNHDPQDVETKRHPFAQAADGAIGLETLLAAALRLYHNGTLALSELLAKMTIKPAELFGLPTGRLTPGAPADVIQIDLDVPWVVREEAIRSRAKNTPFEGALLTGQVTRSWVGGRCVFSRAREGRENVWS